MPDDDGKILSRLIRNMHKRGEDPLTPLIDRYYMERDASPNRLREYRIDMTERPRPPGRFSPSNMGGCMRQAAFKFVGMPGRVKKDPMKEIIFDQGHWQHHKWQSRFLDMQEVLGPDTFKVISTEASVMVPEIYVAGSSDNVLRMVLESNKKRKAVLDIKSINDNGYTWVTRNDEPHETHVKQITTYGKGHGLKWGILLYDNKNNQEFKVFMINFEDSVWVEVSEWAEEVINFLETERVPPMHPECMAGNFLWNKCPYASWCYGTATPVKIRRKMYRDFPGVQEAWRDSIG